MNTAGFHPGRPSCQQGSLPLLDNRRTDLLGAGLLCLTLTVGCGRDAAPAVVSPDGSLTLVTSVEHTRADPRKYLCVVFEIRDRTGKVLHSENTGASHLSQWRMNWASTNEIRLVSSDIGTYCWSSQADGTWKKE